MMPNSGKSNNSKHKPAAVAVGPRRLAFLASPWELNPSKAARCFCRAVPADRDALITATRGMQMCVSSHGRGWARVSGSSIGSPRLEAMTAWGIWPLLPWYL